jgi:hypothetical protein
VGISDVTLGWAHITDTKDVNNPWSDWQNAIGFGVIRTPNGKGLILPHWLPVLVATAFGALPWLTWRFSLRTLLIATTLVAVALGLVAVAIR